MKNLLKILPLIPLCLACGSDSEDGMTASTGNAIVFDARIDNTRAVADITDIQTDGFKVWGGYGTTTVFNGENIVLGSDNTHTTDKKWTFNTYNFYAVYPTTVNAAYTPLTTFTINNYNVKDNKGTDLMIATATSHVYPDNGEAVGLYFRHALAQLEFVGSSTDANSMALLWSIKLYGAGIPATATYNNGAWTLGAGTTNSSTFITSNNNGSGWRLSKSGNTVLNELYVFPNTSGKTVTVELTSYNGQTTTQTVDLPQTTWEAGKIYRYTFSIDPNLYIVFSEPEVTEWHSASAGNIVVE